LGADFLRILFSAEFLAVHPVATVLFASLTFYNAALTCHGLLYIRNQPRAASLVGIAHAGVGILGIFLVLVGDGATASLGIAWVFLVAAALFCAAAYAALGHWGGLRLPVGRSLLLALPTAPAVLLVD